MSDQARILACDRVTDLDPRALLPGSVTTACGTCGAPVFVSVSGQAERRRNPATVVACMRCVEALVEERERLGREPMEAMPVEGGLEEAWLHLAQRAAAGARRPS